MAGFLRATFGAEPKCALLFLLGCLALNVVANSVVTRFNPLLFLDMLGTALAAIALGPWWAAAVGLFTNLILRHVPGHTEYFNFAIVNVFGGMVWGCAAQTKRLAPFRERTTRKTLFLRLLGLGVLGGLVCSATGVCTRFGFVFQVTDRMIAAISSSGNQAADARILAAWSDYLKTGDSVFRYIRLDIYSMFPDKIVSIAVAAFLFYYFPPSLSPKRSGCETARSSRLAAGIFLFLYSIPLATVLCFEYINLVQASLWVLPAVLAILVSVRRAREAVLALVARVRRACMAVLALVARVRRACMAVLAPLICVRRDRMAWTTAGDWNMANEMEAVVNDVYKDILGLVVLWYAILLIIDFQPKSSDLIAELQFKSTDLIVELRSRSPEKLTVLVRDGLGIFAIFAYLPPMLMRYFAPRSRLMPTSADEGE
jgi:predicted membrane protein